MSSSGKCYEEKHARLKGYVVTGMRGEWLF